MKKTKEFFFLILAVICMSSCIKSNEDIIIMGWIPVHGDSIDLRIKVESARPVNTLERIYIYDEYIFAVEKAKGVHIIDNSNPESPLPIHFLSIPGTTEVAIKDQYLYTDQFSELVVLDIHDIAKAMELKRIKSVFPNSGNIPDQNAGYFQCPEEGEVVIGWIRDSIPMPDCYN